MTKTDLGTITCKWYIQFMYYLWISVEKYMAAEEKDPSKLLKKTKTKTKTKKQKQKKTNNR